MLGERHAIVLQKHHLQPVAADGIGIDLGGKGVDEVNDALGDRIARRSLRAKEEHPRLHGAAGVILQLLVEIENVHGVEQLALVLVQALDLHVEDRVRVEYGALRLFDVSGKVELIGALDLAKAVKDRSVVRIRFQLLQRLGVQQILVAAAEGAHQPVEPRIDLREPAAMVDAVGDVFEFFRLHGALVFEYVVAQNVGMQGAHAVHGHAAGNAEVCHPHLSIPDDGKLARFCAVVIVILHLCLIAAGDLHQDRPDARQQRLHQLLRPALQRFGHNGVVRVGNGLRGDAPRSIPVKARIVHQDAHQLWDDERRVRVVDLDDVLLVEIRRRAVNLDVLAHDGLHRGGNKEILLLQAQALPLGMVVLGIKHLGDGLSHGVLLLRAQILTLRKERHIERHGRLCIPQPQRVHSVCAVAGDLHIAGDGQHLRCALRHNVQPSAVPELADRAAELDRLCLLRLWHEPCAAQLLPVVRQLYLLAVHDALAENAQLIADGIACGRDIERGHGIEIAGGEAAKAAVAQPRVRLAFKNVRRAEAQLVQRLGKDLADA